MRLGGLASLLLAPALVSCVWLLDFDELQKGSDAGGTTGGTAGASSDGGGGLGAFGGLGANGGTAGSAGGGDCPSECLDDDPCTLDGCTTEGECTREPVLGLALDGVDETIPAQAQYRTTIAAGADAFYLSNFTLTEGVREVTFYRLDANAEADALSTIATLGGLALGDAVPLSAAGLAVDTALGRIHAFIGMENSLGNRLWHVVLDGNYQVMTRTAVPGGYGLSPRVPEFVHPVAANLGRDIAAAWINADLELSLWTGALAGPARLAVGRTPMTVSLLGSADNQPFVLYGVSGGGVFVEGDGIPAAGIAECQVRPGYYLSSWSTYLGIPGFWLGYWTKYGDASGGEDGFLTSDGRGFGCSATGCTAPLEGDCGSGSNGIRNPAAVAVVRPGDPTGLVHLVQLTPIVAPEEGSSELLAGLVASATRIDFGRVPFQSDATETALGTIELGIMPTSLPALAGPDWPTVAYVPPDRIAITWTQPSQSGGGELRVQRYRLCAPD